MTDYKHPFDEYEVQDVLIFAKFRSSMKIKNMLSYLDGYPLVLPCRYFNRQACFTKVYIITNIPMSKQYPNADGETRKAFLRRIHEQVEFHRSVEDIPQQQQFYELPQSERITVFG